MTLEPDLDIRRHVRLAVAGMDVADAGLKWTGWSFAAGWKLRN
ncbi:hypothetical protein ACH49M_21675 [Rhodococcus qingshengii]